MKKPLAATLFCVIGIPILQVIAYLLIYVYLWVDDMKYHAQLRFLFFAYKKYENIALVAQLIIFIFLYFGLLLITILVERPRIRISAGLILMVAIAFLCALPFPSSILGLAFFYNMTFNLVFYIISYNCYQRVKINSLPNRSIPL